MKQEKAESIIKKFWGAQNVGVFKTEISDYIVRYPVIGLNFAVKCIALSLSDYELKTYIGRVISSIQLRGAPKLPVTIIRIDENTGNAECGVVLYYHHGTATVENDIHFIPMNDESRTQLIDELKSADKTIRILEKANCKVIKTIVIEKSVGNARSRAKLVYLRDLNLTYKMNGRDDLSDVERLNYYLKGIPEEDYPTDKLDKSILDAVKNQGFMGVAMNSKLLIFSSELRELKLKFNRQSKQVNFLFVPDLSSCSMLPMEFPLRGFNVDLIKDCDDAQVFDNLGFTVNVSLNSLDDYYDFIDGAKTLCSMKQFLNI